MHGLPEDTVPSHWDWYTDFGISDAEFWGKIHDLGDAFYGEYVQPYPWANLVMELALDADEVVVMTSPSNHPSGYAGKKIFLDKHFPGAVSPKDLIVGCRKELLAAPDRLLVDDGPHNIEAFSDAGGATHMFLQPWNTTLDPTHRRIPSLRAHLQIWREDKNA